LWCSGRKCEGEAGRLRGESGDQTKFTEVLPADASDGIKDKRMRCIHGRGRSRRALRGNRIRKKRALSRRDSCRPEKSEVLGVNCKVVDLRSDRIGAPVVTQSTIVVRAALLGEIMNMHDKGDLAFGELGNELWEVRVFSEGGIMKVPASGRMPEDLGGSCTHSLQQIGCPLPTRLGDSVVESLNCAERDL
tara:strand:+ start:103 stop:675 length:573 start_codon:yes stop_codon:yes gene_type:complete